MQVLRTVPNTARPNGTLDHLITLYFERAAELWARTEPLRWLQEEATRLLDTIEAAAAAEPTAPTTAPKTAPKTAAIDDAHPSPSSSSSSMMPRVHESVLECARASAARCLRFYPAGGPNLLRGCEYTKLIAEQVIMPLPLMASDCLSHRARWPLMASVISSDDL